MTTIAAIDFSSIYIPSITPVAAQQLAASGVGLAVIGYDSTAASASVRAAVVSAGMAWHAYRLPVNWADPAAQVNDTIAGIHAADVLPAYLWLDIEPTSGVCLSIAQLEAAMTAVEAADILPAGTLVKPGIYSSPGIWQQFYPGYTGPADRGWALWGAWWNGVPDLTLNLFGGWTADAVVGHQYAGSSASAIGIVDLSVFAGAAPAPVPSPIDPVSALARITSGRALQAQAVALLAQADADYQAAEEDLTPA